ncbi:hypothetical protein LCGC14_0756700 [marine sediment metagenome]|uniref:Uncharacterized protein n=1 Tax=marine sediment metagenome TaxID=412755 RepID=A0A0F9Q6H3_9ZZZZ|nr:hypothetical protein [Pricia sp.]
MTIWKRIEKLEKLERQRNCDHSWGDVKIGISPYSNSDYPTILVWAKCCICGLEKEERGKDPEIRNAYLVLKDLFNGVVREKSDSEKQKGTAK